MKIYVTNEPPITYLIKLLYKKLTHESINQSSIYLDS